MQIDASTLMWVFGLCFVSLTGLLGVIWAMLNKRLNAIEDQAEKDRTEFRITTSKLFDELKADREKSASSDGRILEVLVGVRAEIANIAVKAGERRADCGDKFATKQEVNDGLNSVRSVMKKGA